MSYNVGPMVDSMIEKTIIEINKKHNKDRIIEHIIYPLLCDVNRKFINYFIVLIIILIIIILLLINIIIKFNSIKNI